jgi:uncharacterized membrane protein YkvA (DUF1232 family)
MMRLLQSIRSWARRIKAQVLTLWFCSRHPDTPLAAKILAALVAAYAFSPIDLIPDFIPLLGYLDEVILLPLGIYLALRMIPDHVIESSRIEAEQWMERKRTKPRNYAAAGVIFVIWLGLAYWAWQVCSRWYGAR